METWTNADAGPIQLKRLEKVLSAMRYEHKCFGELTGVKGRPETEHLTRNMSSPFSPTNRQDVTEAWQRLGEKFGWTVTSANHKEIIAAATDELRVLQQNRPIHDQRREPEEADRQAVESSIREEDRRVEKEARDWLRRDVEALRPPWAEAVILAELQEDKSDLHTDYHANVTKRCVAIGWRSGKREDFRQLRAAAARFPETAHLASQEALNAWAASNGRRTNLDLEHRDNYSMGAGNYLSDHDAAKWGSGWVVYSRVLSRDWGWYLTGLVEDLLREPAGPESDVSANAEGVTIRPSSLGKADFVEIVFDSKPSEEVRTNLKRHGFRWAKSNSCWYGRDKAFAQSLVPKQDDQEVGA